ncbi:MAG: hypothetical protein J7484_03885 [Microbacterium sp.]|nr:hypothetical protein [Microbacterium sp.]
MRDFVRSELLRSLSGTAMLAIASFTILIPALMLGVAPSLEGLRNVDDETATRIVFGLIASIGIVAMYLGSYVVSREHYYRSMTRSLVIGSRGRVFTAKLIAAAVTSTGLCIIGAGIWAIVSAFVLSAHGRQLQLGGAFWAIVVGAAICAICGSAIGVALGWIVREYYSVTAIVLLVPLMLELPLLLNLSILERFLPVGLFAGVTDAPIEGVLPSWLSALVLLGWSVVTVSTAWLVLRGRES